jgi:hypothetical protein
MRKPLSLKLLHEAQWSREIAGSVARLLRLEGKMRIRHLAWSKGGLAAQCRMAKTKAQLYVSQHGL